MLKKKWLNRGWASRRLGADRREGLFSTQFRRAFIAEGKPLTTRELVQRGRTHGSNTFQIFSGVMFDSLLSGGPCG